MKIEPMIKNPSGMAGGRRVIILKIKSNHRPAQRMEGSAATLDAVNQ